MRKVICMLLAAAMLLAVTGCAESAGGASSVPAGKSTVSKNITVTDDNGNMVTFDSKVSRIAVCDLYPLPSVLAVFFDSAKNIVAMPAPSMTAAKNSLLSKLYPEILKANTSCQNGSTVNVEQLAALKPDVVFYSASDKETGTQLKNAGFKAVAISVSKEGYNCIETLNRWIEILSQIFPDNDKTKIVRDYSNKEYAMVQSRVKGLSDSERARVFFLFQYNASTIMTSGKHFFGQWWADAIGARNAAEELSGDNAVSVNMEQIYKWNPGIVLITNFTTAKPADLYKNTVGSFNWSAVQAIKDKQAYKMPLGMYRSYTPGVDTPITLMWLAKTVYPRLFSDIDITKETKAYYKTVFGVELTDSQAQSIFSPATAAGSGF